jgi:hypothetical protein
MNRVTGPTHNNNSANELLLADIMQMFMNRMHGDPICSHQFVILPMHELGLTQQDRKTA